MSKLVSFVIPVYNEEANLSLLYRRLKDVTAKLKKRYRFEFLFVNDGSTDQSGRLISKLSAQDRCVKYIELSRNFGKEIALTAGLNHAKGEVAITLDADLQHPVKLAAKFLERWEKGADVVIGIRQENKGDDFVRRFSSILFYKIMNFVGGMHLVPRATDYRLIDRKVIDEFNRFTERSRITRGLLDWLGFKRDYIYFSSKERAFGKPGYSILKLTRLAFSSFVSLSLFPLRLAGYLGVVIMLFSGTLGLFILVNQYVLDEPVGFIFSGTAILAIFIMFLIGIVLVSIGLIALYIANIHNEVLNRPMYVIREKKL